MPAAQYLAAALSLFLAAGAAGAAPAASAAAPAATPAAAPTDAEIAEIVLKANQVDVDAGHLAEERATSPQVKSFAREMVAAHGAVSREARALVTKLMIEPVPSVTSHSLEGGGAANIRRLSSLRGIEFDRAYIGHEVAYHQHVIDALDQILIPNTGNAQLKSLLVAVRPAFVAHLEHARHLQDELLK